MKHNSKCQCVKCEWERLRANCTECMKPIEPGEVTWGCKDHNYHRFRISWEQEAFH